ncbi:MAG TPA: alpha-amylase family glycosyl hydrolase [Herpetosiphonaceae bacterium]
MTAWAQDAIFYHIYPLGLCGAPRRNSFDLPAEPRLAHITQWIEHMQALGVTALYLGPLFESSAHGYDTADFYRVDRRLGDNQTLADLVAALHAANIRVILDGVFHHVGRDFWAFRDLQAHGEHSRYRDWFAGIDFGRRSPHDDPFAYDGWHGHYDLIKLNLHHPEVREHLFGAVEHWINQFGIDGLRLDVAEDLDPQFLRDLAAHCRRLRPNFWLLGEAIHGDYRRLAGPGLLDSVTDYECYKGLYSSHNDRNFFEIAYSLDRQFGPHGIYRELPLYTFVDNHDVNRIASTLHNPAHLYPLHALLFTMPGVPSIYYGSEWGLNGKKHGDSDWSLRPHVPAPDLSSRAPHPDLAPAIARLTRIRHQSSALRRGAYQQLFVGPEVLAFARRYAEEYVVVVISAAAAATAVDVPVAAPDGSCFVDLLDPGYQAVAHSGRLAIDPVPSCWARVLVRQ